jgi:hypothetical protein
MGTTIITAIIASLTSISVALITAGYFKQYFDSIKDRSSRKKLTEQLKKDEVIHHSIREIRNSYNADRVTITQFHNGGNFYTNSPMQKSSITYERMTRGLEPISQRFQNILVSNFSWYNNRVLNNEAYFFSTYEDILDLATKSILKSHGSNSHVGVPIFDRHKNLVAILALDWSFNEIPEFLIDKEKYCFTQEFKENIYNQAQSLLIYF